MTEVAFFSNFIKQHRSELPTADGISSFADEITEHINEIASDYMRGDFTKWVDQLLEPNTHGITLSRQEAAACIRLLCEEKERVISLARLFAEEVAHYDRLFGQPACVREWDSSEYKVQRASFLFGLALGSVPDLCEPATPQTSQAARIQKKWSFEKIVIIAELVLNLYNTYQSNRPDPQITKLAELQEQGITVVQQIDEKITTGMDQIGDWVIAFGDAYTERTEAINAQTEAIKENTQAVAQLTEKLESAEEISDTQADVSTDTLPECDCVCHDSPE